MAAGRPSSPLLPAGIASGVLLLGVVGAGLRGPWRADPGPAALPEAETPPPVQESAEQPSVDPVEQLPMDQVEPREIPDWVTDTLVALAIAVGVGLLILGARWLWAYLAARRTARAEAGATGLASTAVEIEDVPDLAPALQQAARALREGTQPRDAIVSAWVALEEAAAESGAARSPADTPTEFTTALLGRTGADPRALLRLREIYRAARFGHRPPTAEDVAAASDALRRIEETWEGRVSAP